MIYLYFKNPPSYQLFSMCFFSPLFLSFISFFLSRALSYHLYVLNHQWFPQGFLYTATTNQNLPSNYIMLLTVPCKKLAIIHFLLYCVSLLPQILLSCMLQLYSMSLLLLLNAVSHFQSDQNWEKYSLYVPAYNISYFAGLIETHSSFCLSGKTFISYSVLENTFCLVENSGFTDFTKLAYHHFQMLSHYLLAYLIG